MKRIQLERAFLRENPARFASVAGCLDPRAPLLLNETVNAQNGFAPPAKQGFSP